MANQLNNSSKVPARVLAWLIHEGLVVACLLGLAWMAVHPEWVLQQSTGRYPEGWVPPALMVIPSLIAVGIMSLAPFRPGLGLILSIAVGYGFPRRESYEFFCRWHVTEVLALLSVTALVVARLRDPARSKSTNSTPSPITGPKPGQNLSGTDEGLTNSLGPSFVFYMRNPLSIALQLLMVWVVISASVAYFGGQYHPVSNHNLFQMFTATCLWMVAVFCLQSAMDWYWIGISLGTTLSVRTLVAPQFIHLEGDMGVLQSISIPLTIMAIVVGRTWQARLVAIALVGFQIWTLLNTENRGGLVGLTVALLIGWVFCKKKWRLLLLATPILLAVGFAFENSNYRERFEAIWRGGPDRGSVDSRFTIYEACWKMFRANPILGVGLGNSEPRMAEYSDERKSDSPHSNVMGMLAETGAVGTALYLLFFGGSVLLAFWLAFRTPSSAEHWVAICLGSSLIAYQVSGMFMTRHTLELAYMLAGGVIALGHRKPEKSQQDMHHGS